MSSDTYYALDVLRVDRIPKKAKDAALYVEVRLDDAVRKTGMLDDEGKPALDGTLIFTRSDNDAITFDIHLRNSVKCIGHVIINATELLQESAGSDVRRNLVISKKPLWSSKAHSEDAGSIVLRLKTVDAQIRAQIEVNAAEESVKQLNGLVQRNENIPDVTGTVIGVVDMIIGIIDDAAEIDPIVNVSWKIVTALYKVVSNQLKTESELVDLVYKVQKTYEFCAKAGNLEDKTELLKPIIKALLSEIIECSRFVQIYSGRGFIGRTARLTARQEVEVHSKLLDRLRGEMDSVIGLHTAQTADATQSQQHLEELGKILEPFKPISDISTHPRCLEGTREEYLTWIMDFVSSETAPNILWLSGVAGCGKSTVAVTVSGRCTKEGYQPVHLFFEREKSKPSSIVRTIAYELACRFPSVAREIIKTVKRNNNIKDSELKDQFKELLLDPLNASANDVVGPIVIILDALDESGSSVERRRLLRLLKDDFSLLPQKVRILVTSRPEEDIEACLSSQSHVFRIELAHGTEDSRHDVDHYITNEVKDLVKGCDDEIQVLCSAANGLFIWASTAIKMVQEAIIPRRTLQRLAKDIESVGGYGLDSLYETVLEGSGIWQDVDSKDDGTRILGFILLAKEAMSSVDIGAFLGLEEDTIDRILGRLRSVVSYELGKPVRLHHASFADYLLSSDRSGGKLWRIDETKEKQAVTERCLGVMAENLRFNICGVKTSFLCNKEDSGLKRRIEDAIRPHLDYACRFWAAHVCELPSEDRPTAVLSQLKTFMESHLLYWFEVLSLTEQYDRVAVRALYGASQWSASIDKELNTLIWEAYRLASVFAYPISQSAPHIYLSAISLWKSGSPVADLYSETHPVVKIHRLGKRRPTQCIKILREHTGPVKSVSISPDGRFIASGSDDQTIRVWDTDSGRPIWSFDVGSRVKFVAFSLDSKQIVSSAVDETIRVVNVDTGELVSGPYTADKLKTASFADGNRVILVQDYILYFENGELVSVLVEDDIRYLAVSSDGKFVLGSKGIWNAGSGKRVSEFDVDDALAYAVSPDGKRVVTGSYNGIVVVWNDRGELVTGPFKAHSSDVFSVAFSQDVKRVVSGDWDGSIAVWDADNGRIIWGPFNEHTLSIMSVIFTPDGKRVISGSHDDTIRIWDVGSTDAVLGSLEAHAGSVISIAFSADGKRFVSGSEDNTIRVWDVDAGKHLSGPFEGHADRVHSVAFFPDGKRIVSASGDGTIRIWDANNGKLVLKLPQIRSSSGIFLPVCTDGKRIISGTDSICIWDAETGERVSGPRIENVISVALSPDSRRIVSASEYDTISIWDTDSGELLLGPLEGHRCGIYSLVFSPDGKRIASGSASADETIRIWDADSGELISGPFKARISTVFSVAFSPNSKLLVSGSWDKTICVWDVDSGGLVLGPLKGHKDSVASVMFSPVDGNRVVSGSFDKTIRLWDVSRDGAVAGDAGKRAMGASLMSYNADDGIALYSQNSVRTASTDRKMSKWTLCDDGWVKGEEGELLIWIPEDMRASLWTDRTIAILSCPFTMKLDLHNSPVGEDWSNDYPRK